MILWLVGLTCLGGTGPSVNTNTTINLMVDTQGMLGNFEDEGWGGYACNFSTWSSCVNSTASADSCNNDPESPCRRCTSTRGREQATHITCTNGSNGGMVFRFPAGGIFPVTEQFTIPPNTAIVGAANPNHSSDKTLQQIDVGGQTWFVVPASNTLCGNDPLCKNASAKGPTACIGDPRTHRQGFLMSSNSMLKNINFQGADLGRAASEGTLCGPGAIELPGCLSGDGCKEWDAGVATTGAGVVENVTVENVRMSDAVKRANIMQMGDDCRSGEALDSDGNHVRAHQVTMFASKLPAREGAKHRDILVSNLVTMNSRADGLNIHGAVQNLVLKDSHIENSGDDCIGIWSTGIENMTIQNTTAANCAVTAGVQSNWGSCMGTYAFKSLDVHGFTCYDPFLKLPAGGCNARSHYTAMHLNHAFANDCMPMGASLSLTGIEYYSSDEPTVPLDRPKCGQCRSCCGSCSTAGFDALDIHYLDDSVPAGSCMAKNAGC